MYFENPAQKNFRCLKKIEVKKIFWCSGNPGLEKISESPDMPVPVSVRLVDNLYEHLFHGCLFYSGKLSQLVVRCDGDIDVRSFRIVRWVKKVGVKGLCSPFVDYCFRIVPCHRSYLFPVEQEEFIGMVFLVKISSVALTD